MCWMTNRKEHAKKLKADCDLKVFKVVLATDRNTAKPYFFNNPAIEYQKNKTYTGKVIKLQKSKSSMWFKYYIMNGFHSYDIKKLQPVRPSYSDSILVQDSDENVLEFYHEEGAIVMECTIPKGTTYYENEKGEIVSDSIRVDNFVQPIKEKECVGIAINQNA